MILSCFLNDFNNHVGNFNDIGVNTNNTNIKNGKNIINNNNNHHNNCNNNNKNPAFRPGNYWEKLASTPS